MKTFFKFIFSLFTKSFVETNKVWPCGFTIKQVKEILETQSHCGKYWNIKSTYNSIQKCVEINMPENEGLFYNLLTGKGYRKDYDFDGCSQTVDYNFKILPHKDKRKTNVFVIVKK